MTDLPKRGDRVRVTEVTPSSALKVGAYATLANDAHVYEDDWIHFDFVLPPFVGVDVVWSGPVKVEILERATEDTACYCSDRMSGGVPCLPGRCPNQPERSKASERRCACGAPLTGAYHVTCGKLDCITAYAKAHPSAPTADYTRGRRDGMRRVVEIAEGLSSAPIYEGILARLKEAVEKELKNG